MDAADLADREIEREDGLNLARALRVDEGEIVEIDGVRYCCDCDAVIPQARIAARPDAGRCVDCQKRRERRRTLYGRG